MEPDKPDNSLSRRRFLQAMAAGGAVLALPITPSSASGLATPEDQPDAASADVWVPTDAFNSSSYTRVPHEGGTGPQLDDGAPLHLETPIGGRSSAQLAVTAGESGLDGVRVKVSDLGGRGVPTLDGSVVQVRYPKYIPDEVNGGVVADPLLETPHVDVPAGANQPVWLTVEVPQDTKAGRYQGTVTVHAGGTQAGTHPLVIDVPDVTLRPMAERPFVLDLWAHPDAVADQAGVELWSEEHWDALRPYLVDLAEHGQRVVDVAITEDPWMVTHQGQWRPQTYSHYNPTVEWLWDGERFTFDFSVFDRYVTESRAAGIGPTIHAFAMLQFDERERFVYTDTRTGEKVVEEVDLVDERYREGWSQFLAAFTEHLKEKGWYKDTRPAFDERPSRTMEAVFGFLEETAPDWLDKIALAANSLSEADLGNYISFNYSFLDSVPDELIAQRRAEDKPTLFYTYYNPLRPNTVTASPPVSSRVLGWVVAQRNLDGYLRWTYNSWPKNVYEDPSFRYGQGDEYLVYPGENGPVSSIRWEAFRDGQDDAELLDLYEKRFGRDDLLQSALNAVDPQAAGAPETWATMTTQRTSILHAMAEDSRADVEVITDADAVVAGDELDLTITLTPTGKSPVPAPRLDLSPLPKDQYTVLEAPKRGAVRPGQEATWVVRVTVPDETEGVASFSGRVTVGNSPQVLGSFTVARPVTS